MSYVASLSLSVLMCNLGLMIHTFSASNESLHREKTPFCILLTKNKTTHTTVSCWSLAQHIFVVVLFFFFFFFFKP